MNTCASEEDHDYEKDENAGDYVCVHCGDRKSAVEVEQ